MGIPVLIYGKSGSGKSTSLRNFNPDEILLINVNRKPLPFKKKFADVLDSDKYVDIGNALTNTAKKTIIIDDAGYLITNMFMKGHSNFGAGNAIFQFYNELSDRFWKLLNYIKNMPEDVIVYVVMHEETDDFGRSKPKTIGKLLDEKVCIEGICTLVLRCITENGNHYFRTHTDGNDVSKTSMDMFNNDLIDNDLKAVDNVIRDYYGLGGGK